MTWLYGTIAFAFAFAFIIIPMGLVIWMLIDAARGATWWVNTCRKCGYDLRHLRDTRNCPECGQPFHVDSHGDAIS